jgi:HD-GYP domain-containing protein (c-di-GMP phosphodiesterase class II)
VAAHHERWDGGGYPRRLRAFDIPRCARIFAVVDAFDAMTNERPYRAAMKIDLALAEIERCRGSQFDPLVVEAFLSLQDIRPAA